jgi:hypothetical protein
MENGYLFGLVHYRVEGNVERPSPLRLDWAKGILFDVPTGIPDKEWGKVQLQFREEIYPKLLPLVASLMKRRGVTEHL